MVKRVLKAALFFVIYYTGALYLLTLVLKKLKKKHCAVILFYHRFSDHSFEVDQLPYLNIQDFKKQIGHLKRWYRVIAMDELAGKLANKTHFTSPCIVITLDDGYLNNYTLAYPVLKALELPAIIYLTTGFIGTNKAPWVDDLMDILFLKKAKTLRLPELFGEKTLAISTRGQKRDAFKILFNTMLQIEHEKKMKILEKMSKSLEVEKISRNPSERKMLNWNEVIEMSRNNISFGAHTASHPTLSRMGVEEAKREIYESREEIEKRIGGKVRHFAIPNGRSEDFTDELRGFCNELGFDTIVTTEPGSVYSNSDRFSLKRILPPPPLYYFACEIAKHLFLK